MKRIAIILIILMAHNVNMVKGKNINAANNIPIQKLKMSLDKGDSFFIEELLPGEIDGVTVKHVILAGPQKRVEKTPDFQDAVYLFIKGSGQCLSGKDKYIIDEESIAFSTYGKEVVIVAGAEDTLHYLIIYKKLTPKDLVDLKSFPTGNREKFYFRKYLECKAYTEKIKSPNTVSRTLLPKDHIPRVAMGTVEAPGPDEVKPHKHPMLEQLFLGLSGNDVTVHADDASVHFTEFTILHIPRGSSHWVTVDKGKRMYYQWMDFFLTKEGEEWLKTHKDIEKENKK